MTNEEQAALAAADFRRDYNLGNAPINDLSDLIEGRLGIDVAIVEMDDGLDGMVLQDPETNQRIISVACTTSMERQRATLAHEVGHLELKDFAEDGVIQCGVRSAEEIRADSFARHLLVPQQGVTEFLEGLGRARQQLSEGDLAYLVRYFEASPMMVLIQLENAGWLAQGQKEAWKSLSAGKLAARYGWSDEHRASQKKAMTPQAPMRIVAEAMKAYENNVIGLEAVARIRGIRPADLKDELDEVGITPKPVELPPTRFGRRQ
ncbi:ImmA/IrrE family metallo-endopeptidase [Arthrobacter crystallopoietes]|uniref:ImmA/IrrE family metallo-endopeptidase n=1 Tax=Crystallibacter crystallopoietes TaxID=37928 RepID=UPI001305350C|nr:ImmA/IrrE family metallo-endopeptidase [Arthrobacter crystallopoietes]